MSETMKHFLAGQLYCLPYILPMYAPTINSYKRMVENGDAFSNRVNFCFDIFYFSMGAGRRHMGC